jgi:hypothetical protein
VFVSLCLSFPPFLFQNRCDNYWDSNVQWWWLFRLLQIVIPILRVPLKIQSTTYSVADYRVWFANRLLKVLTHSLAIWSCGLSARCTKFPWLVLVWVNNITQSYPYSARVERIGKVGKTACHGNCRTQLAAAQGIPLGIRTNQSFGAEFSQRCMPSTPKPAAATWEREMEWNGKVRGTHVPRDCAYLHFYPGWRGILNGMGRLKIRGLLVHLSKRGDWHVLFTGRRFVVLLPLMFLSFH